MNDVEFYKAVRELYRYLELLEKNNGNLETGEWVVGPVELSKALSAKQMDSCVHVRFYPAKLRHRLKHEIAKRLAKSKLKLKA